jgi:hypothetical protein
MSMRYLTEEDFAIIKSRIENDPNYARELIKKIMPKNTRELEGKEKEHILLLIKLTKPITESNNQRFWYEEYFIGGKTYHITYGIYEEPIVEEELNETNT